MGGWEVRAMQTDALGCVLQKRHFYPLHNICADVSFFKEGRISWGWVGAVDRFRGQTGSTPRGGVLSWIRENKPQRQKHGGPENFQDIFKRNSPEPYPAGTPWEGACYGRQPMAQGIPPSPPLLGLLKQDSKFCLSCQKNVLCINTNTEFRSFSC